MKLIPAAALFSAAALFLSGCGSAAPDPSPTEFVPALSQQVETTPAETEPPAVPAKEILNGMTLREKVGQLFLVRPDALEFSISFEDLDNSRADGQSLLSDNMRENLRRYPVGGFIHFQKNIESPEQITDFNQELSASLPIPPFLATDEEGGLVARIANSPQFSVPKFQSAASVGERGPEASQEMGWIIGNYLREYGFNMDFAPVADVNTNPKNPVIGTRAFSDDPEQAALCARAMADGLRRNGIIPVFKHFPGHGDTAEDSHQQLAVSRKSKEELLSCEWIPFRQAEARECIMAGHIALPEVTGDMTPATFSREIITGCLKQELGYRGLIITDSLSMGAVLQHHDSAEAALLALEAGCDILLMPASLQEAFDGVLNAVKDGVFPEDQLNEIVLKILTAKIDYHIINPET